MSGLIGFHCSRTLGGKGSIHWPVRNHTFPHLSTLIPSHLSYTLTRDIHYLRYYVVAVHIHTDSHLFTPPPPHRSLLHTDPRHPLLALLRGCGGHRPGNGLLHHTLLHHQQRHWGSRQLHQPGSLCGHDAVHSAGHCPRELYHR